MNLVHRMTLMAFFLAMAVVLSYVEGFIPFWLPGVKPGLANVVIVIIIYDFSWYDALLVDVGRVFLASLLRGDIFEMPFWMSLAGALCSLAVMLLAKFLLRRLTVYGVSLLGAYFHSLAQVFVAVFFVGSWTVFYYFPFIAFMSILTGLVTALVADRIIHSHLLDHPKGLMEAPKKIDP